MAGEAVAPITDTSVLTNPQTLQQWSNLIDSLFGKDQQTNSSSQSITQNSSQADAPILGLIQNLLTQQGQGVNSGSIQALLAPIFQQFKEGALPQIQGQANAGGGVYNSSTQKLLQNDALARAVTQGGGVAVQQQNNLQNQLAALMAILAKSTAATSQSQVGTNRTSTSGSGSNLGKAALGAAGAAGLGKGIAKAIASNKNNASNPSSAGGDSKGDQEGDYPQYPGLGEGDQGVAGNKGDQEGDYPTTGNSEDPFGIGGYDSNGGGLDGFDASQTEGQDSGSGGGDLSWLDNIFTDFGGSDVSSFDNFGIDLGGSGAGEFDNFDFGGDF